MNQSQHLKRFVILAILMIASMAAVMSTDMYAPSLGTLPDILDTTASKVQLTMAINALCFGLAQIFHGPLSDRFGRRPVMLWGLSMFALFSLLCGLAQNVEQLIAARALQGAAASVEAVLLLAIIGDIFEPKDRPKAFALYGVVWSVAPAIAPVIGGYVHELAGWQWNFYIVAITGVVAFLSSFFLLPETGQIDTQRLNLKTITNNYSKLLRHPDFIGLALLKSLPLASILVYITAVPFILQQQFAFSVLQIGYAQTALVIAYMLSSASAGLFANRLSHTRLILLGISLSLLGIISTAVVLSSNEFTAYQFLACMLICGAGLGTIFTIVPGMIMEKSPTSHGTTAALFGAIEMAMVGLAISLMSSFATTVTKAMANTYWVIAAGIILVCFYRPWQTR